MYIHQNVMKRLLYAFLLCFFTVSQADAVQDYLIGDNRRVYEEKTGWYMGFRAEMNMLSWTNNYNSNDTKDAQKEYSCDKYSFSPSFGGSFTIGKSFSYFWRGEVEAGYTGTFTDQDQGIEFNFSTPYVLSSALYDFRNGLYLGASAGLAFPKTVWNWDAFLPGNREKTSLSPMGGLIFGLSHRLDYRFILDLRYRIAGFYGTSHTRYFEADPDKDDVYEKYYFKSDIGLVLDNQFSLGLRYEF